MASSFRSNVMVLGMLAGCALNAHAAEPRLVSRSVTQLPAANDVLVRFKGPPSAAIQARSLGRIAALNIERLPADPGETATVTSVRWGQQPEVLWAQPNGWRRVLVQETVPNDPYYRPDRSGRRYQQWALSQINANYAWSIARGSRSMVVAVVDTGVDRYHPDLRERVLPGATLVSQAPYASPAEGMDDYGHGTHVAGLIAADCDNGIGIAGCDWNTRILPVKVLDRTGAGLDSDIAEGIVWAADHGARIINLSLGGTSLSPPQVLQDAVDYAYAHGCLIVAAAGNDGDQTLNYPAALNHVVSVAATDPWGHRASYSNFGPRIDLAAPGGAGDESFNRDTGVLSTYWDINSQATDQLSGSEGGEYAVMSGTSMASPMVAAAAAVLWSSQPSWSADQVVAQLKATAHADWAPGLMGAGRIDLFQALGAPPIERANLLTYNYPNPFRPPRDAVTQIVFWLNTAGSVELRLYDVSRTLVWHASRTSAQTFPGENLIAWDGKNDRGAQVASGTYYFQVRADPGGLSALKAIAVLKQ